MNPAIVDTNVTSNVQLDRTDKAVFESATVVVAIAFQMIAFQPMADAFAQVVGPVNNATNRASLAITETIAASGAIVAMKRRLVTDSSALASAPMVTWATLARTGVRLASMVATVESAAIVATTTAIT